MSLIINGTNIPQTSEVSCDNATLEKVLCDGQTVWQLQRDISVSAGSSSGITMLSSQWSHSFSSTNGNVTGNTFYVTMQLDLTPYKRVVINASGWATATRDNSAGYTFGAGVDSIPSTSSDHQIYGYYSTSEWCGMCKVRGLPFTLDVSGYNGIHTVYVRVDQWHSTNRYGEGNGNGNYTISSIQFFTT